MKNCPRCSFLMDDHESVCSTCVAQEPPVAPISEEPVLAAPLHAAGTAVLERPTVVPLSESASFRAPGAGSLSLKGLVLGSVLAAVLTVGVVMGLRHEGPLAAPLEQLGLIDAPTVVVPDQWVTRDVAGTGFSVSMPVGALDAAGHPDLVGSPAVGSVVDLGSDARMVAVSTDFGQGPASMAAHDSDTGFAALVDWYVATAGLGTETVRREVQVSHGRAADLVLVRDDDHTTRARLVLLGDRLVILQTSGPDVGAAALDAAHPSLVDSLDVG